MHLADVLQIYSAARLTEQPTGLLLRPAPTHLPRTTAGQRWKLYDHHLPLLAPSLLLLRFAELRLERLPAHLQVSE